MLLNIACAVLLALHKVLPCVASYQHANTSCMQCLDILASDMDYQLTRQGELSTCHDLQTP